MGDKTEKKDKYQFNVERFLILFSKFYINEMIEQCKGVR
jgi:hypothetical protein